MCRLCSLGRQQDSRHAGALHAYAFCGSCVAHTPHLLDNVLPAKHHEREDGEHVPASARERDTVVGDQG